MQNNSTAVSNVHRNSELFKKRFSYRLEQGFPEEQAYKLAQLKGEIDEIRKSNRGSFKNEPRVGSFKMRGKEDSTRLEDCHLDLSREAVDREIAYQISLGKMSRIGPTLDNSLTESASENSLTSSQILAEKSQSKKSEQNSPSSEKSQRPESAANAVIYISIYALTVAVIVPATAEALGGGWIGWCSGIALDVSIGILFSMIFESTKNPMRFLWALLTAALIFVSYKNLEAGGGVASASKASVYVDQTPEVKTLTERVSRLKIDRDQIPEDQNTNRRRIGEQLTAAENSLLEARKIAAASPKVDAINSSARSSLYVWSALIFISMFSMYRIRACLSDPMILASLLGKG
ncbi:MAG: hypothetical protein EOP04_11195 [Proteobacteria bacterium]|nr:MAG: hypothetical protein EOP04_11195 [Pseudomonadota bacterium]